MIHLYIEYGFLIGGDQILFTSEATEPSSDNSKQHMDLGPLNVVKTPMLNEWEMLRQSVYFSGSRYDCSNENLGCGVKKGEISQVTQHKNQRRQRGTHP